MRACACARVGREKSFLCGDSNEIYIYKKRKKKKEGKIGRRKERKKKKKRSGGEKSGRNEYIAERRFFEKLNL